MLRRGSNLFLNEVVIYYYFVLRPLHRDACLSECHYLFCPPPAACPQSKALSKTGQS